MTPPCDDTRPILLVDDDEDAHFLLKRQLGRCGNTSRIDSVFNGEEAVEYIKACFAGSRPFPRLIFLDVKMPAMTGLEFLSWLKGNSFLSRMPVTMLTSSDEPKDMHAASALGAHAYLLKNPSDAQLTEILSASAASGA